MSTDPQSQLFDLCGPLPTVGVTLLEASAGTGKTFAIAALATRMIAAGYRISDLLVATFTRAAANELRSKVRARLESTAKSLRTYRQTGQSPQDPVDALLCTEPDLALTISRLEQAISDIDLATIATLHEYSARMLNELGLLADHDPASNFVDDLRELIAEVVEDVVTAGGYRPRRNSFDRNWLPRAHQIGRQVCEFPDWQVIPQNHQDYEFANRVRTEFEQRKRRLGVHGYPDMVNRLLSALQDPHTASLAAATLSARFPVVLVDEFQDTDPAQWEILQRAFAADSVVVLIGDPKQAIYGFRGGDVETYLLAKSSAARVVTMGKNYRSDPNVVAGIEQLFAGASLGTQGSAIVLPTVEAHQTAPRLLVDGEPLQQAVQVRQVPMIGEGFITPTRRRLETDLVAKVAELTSGRYQLVTESLGEQRTRQVRPSDIAVLVNTNRRGQQLLTKLSGAGIAATFTGADSIFASQAARDWLDLLQALTSGRVADSRRAALTSFFGYDSRQLAAADDDAWSQIFSTLRIQGRLLSSASVMAVFESLLASNDLYRTILSQPQGERLLTDLRHLAEVLNHTQRRSKMTPTELTSWLHERIATSSSGDNRERVRRLDTDRDVVHITTVHQAKGMEYPIVLLPDLGENPWRPRRPEVSIGHHQQMPVLDLDPSPARLAGYVEEEQAEQLRVAYVACTRARSLLITWELMTAKDSQSSALHRLLRNDQPPGQPPAASYSNEAPMRSVDRSLIDFRPIRTEPQTELAAAAQPQLPDRLEARKFHRTIDRQWTRTSYSGLTAALHEMPASLLAFPSDDADPADLLDEPTIDDAAAANLPQPLRAEQHQDPNLATSVPSKAAAQDIDVEPISQLAALPGGTHFGTLVHEILELADPGAHDLATELLAHTQQVLRRSGSDDIDSQLLAAGLTQVLCTDLGVLTAGQSLADLGKSNQLAEFEFELPMGGAAQSSSLAQLASLIDHPGFADPAGVLAGYGEQLASSAAGPTALRGYLTGSIDVLLRANVDGQEKFLVLDYKTNRVRTDDDVLRPEHYDQPAMEQMMRESHYPLQALLYSIAVHRYLSASLPHYEPAKHLGGVGYLFVRGMAGPASPRHRTAPFGVFTWQPNPNLVVAASKVLAGES